MKSESLPEDRLRRYFDTFWPSLAREIEAANRELQPLPVALRGKLRETFAPMFWNTADASIFMLDLDLPRENINWNQTPRQFWNEIIRVASNHKKLGTLLDLALERYPENERFQDLRKEIAAWEASLPERVIAPDRATLGY